MGARKGVGELLVRENLIDINQLERARQEQKKSGGRLTSALVHLGFIKDKDLAEFMGKQYNLPAVDLASFDIDAEAIKLVSIQICRKHCVIPVQKSGRSLVVAFSDPSNLFIKDDLSLLTRCKIEVVIASEMSINAALDKYYGGSSDARMNTIVSQIEESEDTMQAEQNKPGAIVVDREDGDENSPIIAFVNAILTEAIKLKASDIHLESYEKRFRVRYRVDGSLIEFHQPPRASAESIVSRLKILCKMDIAERRKPQDGRLKVMLTSGQEIDFRVNCIPAYFGEKIVLRLLDKSNLQADIMKLGMEDDQLVLFQKALALPQGMVLITGPTGSGKTTTVYSALGALNTVDVNISTAEDPVEFNFEGINQVQVNTDIGFGFPEALRAFLRQDPEVIMVGEIRDLETASIAYKAAATGHLVISTLHTNDTASTVNRLISMGVPNYLVAESTSLVVAQRLIKRICKNCIVDDRVMNEELLKMGVLESELPQYNNLKKGEGCPKCNGTGLSGRMAIFEVLFFSSAVKDAVFAGGSTLEVKRHAVRANKMTTLRRAALSKLRQGLTSAQEVLTSTVEDDL